MVIETNGPDEEQAAAALAQVIASGFGEEI